MTKPKRYPRARSLMHARGLKAAGYQPRKFPRTQQIGPLSPAVSCEYLRHRFDLNDEQAAEALDAIRCAASGHVIRLYGRAIVTPAGDGAVNLELPIR